jgi:segregation and condensation protein B
MDGDLAIRTDGYGDAILNDDTPVPADGLAPETSTTPAPEADVAPAEVAPADGVAVDAAEPTVADEVPAIVFAPAAKDASADASDDVTETLATDAEATPADVTDGAEAVADTTADANADATAELPVEPTAQLPAEAAADVPAETPADAPATAEDLARLESLIESLLLAAGSPVPLPRLVEVLDGPARRDVVAALRALGARYEQEGRGMRLVHVAGGWQLRSAPEHGPYVRKLLGGRPPRLSRAMLETLAIVAYRQPCTKPEIEAIRGVDVDATLNTLLERRMVRITGRKEAPGRPLLYATTREFLEVFGLPDLNALPPLSELGAGAELLAAPDLTVGPDGVRPTTAAELGFANGNGHDTSATTDTPLVAAEAGNAPDAADLPEADVPAGDAASPDEEAAD